MREIKFRAWDDQSGEIVSWEDMKRFRCSTTLSLLEENDVWKVMQYTGLKDKNGKEICEGDICEFIDLPNGEEMLCIGEVIFEEFGWHFTNAITESSLSCYDSDSVVVIGNIYENGELLNG